MASISTIYVITSDRLNQDGSVKLYAEDGLTTYILDPNTMQPVSNRPCQDGDVLSVNPSSDVSQPSLQGRDKVYGAYELPRPSSRGLVYTILSKFSYLVPYAD